MTTTEATQTPTIAQLNDRFRQGDHTLGQVYTTQLVKSLSSEEQQELFRLVRVFDEFTEDNDPWQEHDYGRIEFKGEQYLWKIDYFDKKLEYGSNDPGNPKVTTRVLTLMHSSEY
ncbi:DUF3768 domain-containing protein (plasmid) [Acaryochloris sp. 'Moss Beach']|uniref:DUF3768 domain-containing protein n=1 Tax=Acaryochloris sp. 'Moss Beach' TaxID=2740837 RepID=UPI001F32404C|nr:DUF3768 domain-containing protein [Acaryochloris sp. 'Moss Beach']UJB72751.1 DUF3768 domain-containing protein [Acaryochloris sp. 'Moss Beach']